MPGFLYYLPKRGTFAARPTQADLAAAGIAHAFDGAWTPRGCHRGPDAGEGTILADPEKVSAENLGYYPDRQTWRAIPCQSAWVGLAKDGPKPGPGDLARGNQLPGHAVQLADGNPWLVPVARSWEEADGERFWRVALPQTMDLGDDGRWQRGEVIPQYRELWAVAERWWDPIFQSQTGEGQSVSLQDLVNSATVAIAANYRVSRIEAAMLGLFDSRSPWAVLAALVDWPTIETFLVESSKKKEAGVAGDSLPTGDGPPAEVPVTAQP